VEKKRFEEIKSQLKYLSTEDLQEILKDRNYDEWTEEAFEAIKRIIDERIFGKSYEVEWEFLCEEAESLYKEGKLDRAVDVSKKALEIAEKNVDSNHPLVATSLNNLAELYRVLGKYTQAESLHKQSLTICEKSLGPNHISTATSLNNLAELYKTQSQYAKAEPLYKRALAIYVKALGKDHPFVTTYMMNLATLQVVEKKNKEITEIEAACLFVASIFEESRKKWPSIAKELNKLLRPKKKFSKKQSAAMEFSFAVIALQIQALPNLLEEEQAKRILEYILKIISTPELGTYPREIIKKYQDEWDACLERAEPAFYGIASVLFDALGCKDTSKFADYYIKDSIVLMALAEQVTKFGNLSWWKNLIERYTIVKDDMPGIDFEG
jgi:tetratricopeptide (TPR) repeat protein